MNRKKVCSLCGSDNTEMVIDTVRFGKKADVYRCGECDLIFLDQDSFVFPEDFYEKEYHQTYLTHIEPAALEPKAYYEKMKKSAKVWADKFSGMLKGDEVVLDVGCSTGNFMDLVKGKVREIYGHELNLREVDFCRNVLDLNVADQPLGDRFKEGTFDYITMIYVLEHISEPKDFLCFLKRFLKPGGKLVILVPNARDALVKLYDIPEFRNFHYCIEHLFYYTPKTIKRLFDQAGMEGEIEVIQEYPITNHLNWMFRRAPSDTLASRRGTPQDVSLETKALSEAWFTLWDKIDGLYKEFLKENDFGDRIWCVQKKTQER